MYWKRREDQSTPEYTCTDSKGSFVATVKKDGGDWLVDEGTEQAPNVVGRFQDLDQAVVSVLNRPH